VYVRHWNHPRPIWAAWVARTQQVTDWDEIDVITDAVGETEMEVLVSLLEQLHELESK
jgi:hypothetical protein